MLNQKIALSQKIVLKPPWTTHCYSLDCVKMIDRHDNNIPMFIYHPPSKRHNNNNNREVKIKMLNNTNNDDDNKKLPPIPPYCEQPSQAEGVLDEALANSDPFVDEANDRWKNGHRVPAKNPTGITYLTTTKAPNAKTCTTTRKISYSHRGIWRASTYSVVWQTAWWTKRYHSFLVLVLIPKHIWNGFMLVVTRKKCWTDIKTPLRPSPTQRNMKFMTLACCTNGCHLWYEKYLAGNDAGSLPMQEDGRKGYHNPMNSASIIMNFLTNLHNSSATQVPTIMNSRRYFTKIKLAHQIAATSIKNQEETQWEGREEFHYPQDRFMEKSQQVGK